MKDIQIAITGIGNNLRGDDGLGNYIIERIEELQIENVQTFIVHQLHVELLEELKNFDTVIFVDASLKDEEIIFEELQATSTPVQSSSHHVNVEMFVQLSKKLYQQNTRFFVCAVKGYDFDMGEKISTRAKINAKKAIEKILDCIKS